MDLTSVDIQRLFDQLELTRVDRETRRQCDISQCKLYRIRHGEDICSSLILTDDPSVNLVCTADDANKTVGREFEDWPAGIDQTKTILVALSAYARARIRDHRRDGNLLGLGIPRLGLDLDRSE